MLLFKTAIKNIIGAGRRTWLNVAVLSFTFVLMILFNGIIDGWINDAVTGSRAWETGDGQFWHPKYDQYDIFSLQDSHGKIPDKFTTYIKDKSLTPILVVQAAVYESGNMQNALLKGVEPSQQILEIPSINLYSDEDEDDHIPAIIGERMAGMLHVNAGDYLLIRWRDKNGSFDAREILIVSIFNTTIATVDEGQIWIGIDNLQKMTGMNSEASFLVKSDSCPIEEDVERWIYKDNDFLLKDLYLLVRSSRIESLIIFSILLTLALLAVFDTQMLSIFRRQKEIGTYISLGMTPGQVTRMFTLEGTSYSLLGIIAGFVWGSPILYWFSKTGLKLPESYGEMGLGLHDRMLPLYNPGTIVTSIVILLILSVFISWIPARRISKSNVVEALRGKIT